MSDYLNNNIRSGSNVGLGNVVRLHSDSGAATNLVVVLASGSPRRSELLSKLIDDFYVARPACDEMSRESDPPQIVMDLARQKADAVVAQLQAGEKVTRHSDGVEGNFREIVDAESHGFDTCEPNAVLISSDTLVVLDGKILGKPHDEAEAAAMLSSLQNDWHSVYTGVCIYEFSLHEGCEWLEVARSDIFCDRTDVHMAALTSEEIADYIAGGSPMDKAGAYGIQDMDGKLVDEIRGLHDTVMGFPTEVVAQKLKLLQR